MTLNQLKKKILRESLDMGMTRVMVAPNTRWAKVSLPAEIMKRFWVLLNLSYKFKGGLEILDFGVKTTLSFNKELYDVEIPWEAITQIVNSNDEEHSFMDIYGLPGDTEMKGTDIEVTDEDKPKAVKHLRVVH